MTVITEIKRAADKDEFAALIRMNNMDAVGDVGGLYIEVTKNQYNLMCGLCGQPPNETTETEFSKELLQLSRQRQPSNETTEAGRSGVHMVGCADDFFQRLVLLDTAVADTDKLMLMVGEQNFRAIPPIQENVLEILEQKLDRIERKIEFRRRAGVLSIILCFETGDNDTHALLDTDEYQVEKFDPELMRKEFFRI